MQGVLTLSVFFTWITTIVRSVVRKTPQNSKSLTNEPTPSKAIPWSTSILHWCACAVIASGDSRSFSSCKWNMNLNKGAQNGAIRTPEIKRCSWENWWNVTQGYDQSDSKTLWSNHASQSWICYREMIKLGNIISSWYSLCPNNECIIAIVICMVVGSRSNKPSCLLFRSRKCPI